MSDFNILVDKLDDVISTGSGRYRARCPSHEGRSRSLSVKEADDRLLIHCFAGCSTHEILGTLGMTVSDLFDKPLEQTPAQRKDQIQTRSAREILDAVLIPIRVIMQVVEIQKQRPLTDKERDQFNRARDTVDRALDNACRLEVINAG